MKVKVGQLKTHLSRYLRELEKGGEPIEVCLRELPVARLTPVHAGNEPDSSAAALQQELQAVGLRWIPSRGAAGPFKPSPVRAGDGRADVVTVEKMRAGRNG